MAIRRLSIGLTGGLSAGRRRGAVNRVNRGRVRDCDRARISLVGGADVRVVEAVGNRVAARSPAGDSNPARQGLGIRVEEEAAVRRRPAAEAAAQYKREGAVRHTPARRELDTPVAAVRRAADTGLRNKQSTAM